MLEPLKVVRPIPPSPTTPSRAAPFKINRLTSGNTQPYDPLFIVHPSAVVAAVAAAIGTPAEPDIMLYTLPASVKEVTGFTKLSSVNFTSVAAADAESSRVQVPGRMFCLYLALSKLST